MLHWVPQPPAATMANEAGPSSTEPRATAAAAAAGTTSGSSRSSSLAGTWRQLQSFRAMCLHPLVQQHAAAEMQAWLAARGWNPLGNRHNPKKDAALLTPLVLRGITAKLCRRPLAAPLPQRLSKALSKGGLRGAVEQYTQLLPPDAPIAYTEAPAGRQRQKQQQQGGRKRGLVSPSSGPAAAAAAAGGGSGAVSKQRKKRRVAVLSDSDEPSEGQGSSGRRVSLYVAAALGVWMGAGHSLTPMRACTLLSCVCVLSVGKNVAWFWSACSSLLPL